MTYGKIDDTGRITFYNKGMFITTATGGITSNPNEETLRFNGYLPLIDTPAPEGKVRSGWEVCDGAIVPVFTDAPPAPIVLSKAKIAAKVDALGLTAAFMGWLNSKAAYITYWMNGGDEVVWDDGANGGDLASLIGALELDADAVAAMIEEVKV